MRLLLLLSGIALILSASECNKRIDYAWLNRQIIKNEYSTPVSLTIFKDGTVYYNFQIQRNDSVIITLSSDGPQPPYFNFSDSAILSFSDGKKKTDYPCLKYANDPRFANCNADTINLFRQQNYAVVTHSTRKIDLLYKISALDYQESQ